MKPLSELSKDEYGYIVDLQDRALTIELFDLGCFPGELIRMVENIPENDFVSFRCRATIIHLFKERARAIITNPTSFHFCLN